MRLRMMGNRVIPTRAKLVSMMGVGGVSNSTPDHFLAPSLGAMNSTTGEDIPSNYALTGEIELEIGLKLLNRETAMLAVKNYNMRRSAEYKVVESDQTRYVCRCKLFGDQCRWMVRVAKTKASRFLEIRKYHGPHSCLETATSQDHAQLDSNVICQHIFFMVQADATICVKVLQGSVQSVYGYKVSFKKVWLAKQNATARIYGDWDDSYNQLRRYFNALQTFIPGTIVDLQTRPYYVGNTLDRDSVMFHQYTGTLLMGIEQDGNNNILPIAFALVERKNTESRHASIKAVLERDGCGWEHSVYCVRHIASNFATNFKSKEAKRYLVNAAYSKTQEQAQYYFELICSEDPATSLAMIAWIRRLEPAEIEKDRNTII
ncbi:uncharacterized protein [Arachis hypogaea]|uniref:uncharacterized protein n=1 Tax=Arachis hypogaea TaxID=3818 RepID=UPI000DEC4F3A|nr:uncharacterized protein LOC112720971 [Arachis hypogaea]